MNPENFEKDNFRYDMSKNHEINKENKFGHSNILTSSIKEEKYKDYSNHVDNSNLMDSDSQQLGTRALVYKSIFQNKDNNFNSFNGIENKSNSINNYNNSYTQNNKMSSTPNKNNGSYNKNYLAKDINNRNTNFHKTINDYNYLKNPYIAGANSKPNTQNINIIRIDDKIKNMDLCNKYSSNVSYNPSKDNSQINYVLDKYNLPSNLENNAVLSNLNSSSNNIKNINEFNEILASNEDSNINKNKNKQNLLNAGNKSNDFFNNNNNEKQYKKNKSAKGNLQIPSIGKNCKSINDANIFKNPVFLDLRSDHKENQKETEFTEIDKNNFLKNAKGIQDLDSIDDDYLEGEINEIYSRTNIPGLNNNMVNIINNSNIRQSDYSKDKTENNNSNIEKKHKSTNSSNNLLEHCSFTSRGNNLVNNSNKIKSTNMNIISRGNKIIDKKILNYATNNSNLINRREYNISKNKNNFQKNYKVNKSCKNTNKNYIKNNCSTIKNNEYANLTNSRKENIENKKNCNKNLKIKEQQSDSYAMLNDLQNHYSTLSNDKNVKNLSNYNKLGKSIGPQNSYINNSVNSNITHKTDYFYAQGKYSLNSTNYIDESNNSSDYNNLLNQNLKLIKTNEKLEEELKLKNKYIKELKIKAKEYYDKNNNILAINKQLMEESKKNEENNKRLKNLQKENLILKQENWEIKNNDSYSSFQKKIKELQEEVEKYKKENNNLKIIIIQNKNSRKKSNNDVRMKLSNSFNCHQNYDDENEERTRNRFYSSCHSINGRRSEFITNSVSKSKRKGIHINKSFKEDLDNERNILKKNLIEEE